jgi:DNA-binding IclR family transcriptional regulator
MAKIVNSCKRALDILELFADRQQSMTVKEISQSINAPVSTCVDLIHTLCAKDYLALSHGRNTYFPTSKLFHLGRRLVPDTELAQAERLLEELNKHTRETCLLTHFSEGQAKVVNVIEAGYPLRYSIAVGERLGFHATASGKSILGLLEKEALESLLSGLKLTKATDQTITSKRNLIRHLKEARARGWYESIEEAYTEIMALAVSFQIGEEIYSMSVVGPITRIKDKHGEYATRLLEIKAQLDHESS